MERHHSSPTKKKIPGGDDSDDDVDGGESFDVKVLKRKEKEGELEMIEVNGLSFVRVGINKLYGKRTKKTIKKYQKEFRKLDRWAKRFDKELKADTPVERDMMCVYLTMRCQYCKDGGTSIIRNAWSGISYFHDISLLWNPLGCKIVKQTRRMCLANVESIREIIAKYKEKNDVKYLTYPMMEEITQQCFNRLPKYFKRHKAG